LTFKKVFYEKWTKKRGSATSEFSGHTTDYYIDGVPVQKKEYTKKIESIVQEDIFKLLTSPQFFNENVKWQDRRKTLLEICGDISDEEVIASDDSLSSLPAILQGRSIENHRKIIAARRAEINKELDRIPVRIDEIQRSLPSVEGLDKDSILTKISELNTAIDDKMTQISSIKNGKAISDKQKAIQEIEIELLKIKQEHDSDSKDKVYSLKARIQEEQSNVSIITSKLENLKNQKRYNDDNIKSIENNLVQLRQEWQEVNGQTFTHTDACECPACGQSLPAVQVEAAREKALSQFNLSKSTKLEEINAKGKQGAERKQGIVTQNEKLAVEYEKINGQITEKNTLLSKLNDQLNQQESLIVDILDNPQYTAKLNERAAIEEEMKQIRDMSQQSIMDIQSEIVQLKMKRDQLQGEVGKFALAAQSQLRIEELETQQRDLAAEYEKLEHELYLTEEFIRTKVNLLEDRINSKFKYARFKLFDTQINGGLTEVCETLFNGVPYSSGLNNAARINVGLDIISTLSQHYGFSAPIFVDNAEAVTKLINMDAQVISLVVSEKDKSLRVETDPIEYKEVI
ncbi:MAG: hypothetical protein Q8898_16220, partial [Bacillota bacterium]|nr:hypothetical protein [Bacillota bacterium]